ncbi:hypothetical protein Taro_052051 [Colocasia esculenta]|uniref:Uncharacterized protein n=1 Tax=Colocasia esculenta TaxID=4460 RepID=A0A843XIL5_COLES|nr:hypothetical protein [Colocasia esculenta]
MGRATQVRLDAVPLARRWLPVVSTATYSFKIDALRRGIRDFSALHVVWEPYAGMGSEDQPWVESGRPRFRQDLWVHCLNEIEPLRLRLAAHTLGLHQVWCEVEEPRGIGRKTRGKAKMVNWHLRFPDQFADWQQGGQLVESEAIDSLAYLRRFQEEYGGREFMRPAKDARDDLIDDLRAQLAGTQAQLAEARADRETLKGLERSYLCYLSYHHAAQTTVERTDGAGASTSWSVPDPETISLRKQLAAAVARAEEAQRDLSTRSGELQDALTQETNTHAELTEAS